MVTPTKGYSNRCCNSQSNTRANLQFRAEEEVHVPTELGHENAILRQENEELRLEYLAMKEALKNPHKSILEHKLLIENARLKEELSSMTRLANYLFGIPASSPMSIDMIIQMIRYRKLASSAMDELLKLGMLNAPLWNNNMEGGGETLNFDEYAMAFPPFLGPKPHEFVAEATRASCVIPMTSSTLVEALLNADRCREMFSSMIGNCTMMEVFSIGIEGSRNGALQLMETEIQLISNLVPVRSLKVIRFTKKREEGLWVVVDLSIDCGTEGLLTRRCPSGCILQDMPNGFTKVTWIEHTEYQEQMISSQYNQLIRSGAGFGAQRWTNALLRHCACLRAITSPNLNHQLFVSTRRCLKGLAQRMTRRFCAAVCLNGGEQWNVVAVSPGAPRIMGRKNLLGEPSGVILSVTYSFWTEAEHRHLFNLLLIKNLRFLWDMISHRFATRDLIRFPLSQDETNSQCITILNSNENQFMVLQEATSDVTGSLIVYANLSSRAVSAVMHEMDTSRLALYPSGLSIVPGYGASGAEGGEHGSMVTVGFYLVLPVQAILNITMDTINRINETMARAVQGIKEIAGQRGLEEGG